MPFGIPPSQEAAYGELVTGVQANTQSLSDFGYRLMELLQETAQLNDIDLSIAVGKITTQLNAGVKLNAADMGQAAQSLALVMASGAQANAADMGGLYSFLVAIPQLDDSPYYANHPPLPPAQQAALVSLMATYGFASPVDPSQASAPNQPPDDVLEIPVAGPPPIALGQPGYAGTSEELVVVTAGCQIDESLGPLFVASLGSFAQGAMQFAFDGNAQELMASLSDPGFVADLPAPITIGTAVFTPVCWLAYPSPGAALLPSNQAGIGPLAQMLVQQTLGGGGAVVPPPPPPPPVPPPPPSPGTTAVPCTFPPLPPFPPCNANDIVSFGSPQMCENVAALAATMGQIGTDIFNWLDQALEPEALIGAVTYQETVGGVLNVWPDLFKVVHNIIAVLKCLAKTVLQTLRALLRFIRDAMCASGCNQGMALGIYLLKALVRSLEKTRLGTDAALWATLDLHIEAPALERLLDYLGNYACPMELPHIPEALECYLKSTISLEVAKCWIQASGGAWDVWEPVLLARAERLSTDELIRQGHREQWTDAVIDQRLKDRGWQIPAERQWRQELFWEIPTIGDHLHWLSRNADNKEYVQKFGLLDGFSTIGFINSIPEWSGYQQVTDPGGRDFWGAYGKDLSAQGMRPHNAAYHYIAHWIQPSPEQMREFVYRLRPGAPGKNVTFTSDDLGRILAEQDYAPLAVKWFQETIYRIPAPTYIIGMYRQNVIGDAELKAYHQDLGYTSVDSDRFVGVDKIIKTQQRTNTYRGWNATAIGNAFVVGRIDDQEARNKALAIGATVQEADDLMEVAQANLDRQVWQRARAKWLTSTTAKVTRSVEIGAMTQEDATAALVSLGWPEERAAMVMATSAATGKLAVIRQTIAAVKRSYHDGFINAAGVQQLLGAAGVIPSKIQEYGSLWDVQNTPRRKRRTAKQIVADLADGMMDTSEALNRLWNLGYNQADSLLYLADAQRKLLGRQAKFAAAAQRDARTQAQMLAKLARQAQAQAKQMRSELQRIAPRSVLMKWLAKGTITPTTFAARMGQLGYPAGAIAGYMYDAPTPPKVTELQKWLKKGEIDDAEFTARAVQLGYTAADAEHYRNQAQPPPPAPAT